MTMVRALHAIPMSLAFCLSACGGDGGGNNGGGDYADYEISEDTLSGVVAGEAWTFVKGHTNAFLSEGEDDFFADLYAEDFEACGFDDPDGASIVMNLPKEAGEYQLSLGQNITFAVGGGTNLIATEGRLIVEEVTDTTVSAALFATYDEDNEVDGQFEMTICAE